MHYIGQALPDQRLKRALVVALLLHGALLAGVSFDADSEDHYRPQIDVTIARQPSSAAPDHATHFAQANQQGSGDHTPQAEVSAPANASLASDTSLPPSMLPYRDGQTRRRNEEALVTNAAAEHQLAKQQEASAEELPRMPGLEPEADQLSRELADLEAALDEQTQAYSNMPRVRRLTSLATRQSIDAAYLHDWRQRVEAVGNRYYPEASVRYGIYGSLRLLVVIDYHGRLEDIRVLSSSGYALLDEAAIKIVRMAAPYAPFPPELRASADKVEIIRTWQFQENRLSSG
jgi:periplasmic protein TonB